MPSVPFNTSDASTEIVPAPGAGRFIRIQGLIVTAGGPTNVTFGADGTDVLPLAIGSEGGGGAVIPPSDNWQFDLPVGEPLLLTLSDAINVRGSLVYRVIP